MRRTFVALSITLVLAACTDVEPTAFRAPARPQFATAPSGFGTSTDLEELFGPPSLSTASGFDEPWRRQILPQFENLPAVERILRRWLTTLVLAKVNPARTDLTLYAALSDYDSWLVNAGSFFPDLPTRFAPELDIFQRAIAEKLASAIDGNVATCGANQSFGALANANLWYDQAQAIGLPGGPYWSLTDDMFRAKIAQQCLTVVVQSIEFPNPVDVDQQFLLRTTTAVRFVGQSSMQPAAFQMDIGINPPGEFLPSAFTNAAGVYETPASFSVPGLVQVTAIACLVVPGHTEPTFHACGGNNQIGTVTDPTPPPPPPPVGVNVTGTWTANFNYGSGGPDAVAAVLTVVFSQTGGRVGGSWTLDDGIHSGSMSFNIGGLDPNCPTCGYLISDFVMTGNFQGRWSFNPSGGAHHVGDPAQGPGIAIDIFGNDSHTANAITHTWPSRRVLFRLVEPE